MPLHGTGAKECRVVMTDGSSPERDTGATGSAEAGGLDRTCVGVFLVCFVIPSEALFEPLDPTWVEQVEIQIVL